jgi:hypothetical protein
VKNVRAAVVLVVAAADALKGVVAVVTEIAEAAADAMAEVGVAGEISAVADGEETTREMIAKLFFLARDLMY